MTLRIETVQVSETIGNGVPQCMRKIICLSIPKPAEVITSLMKIMRSARCRHFQKLSYGKRLLGRSDKQLDLGTYLAFLQ